MKKAIFTCLTLILALLINGQSLKAQSLLKKLQNKIEEEAVKAIFGEDEKEQTEQNSDASPENTSNSPKNTKGSGLSSSSTDVLTSINNAESAFSDKKYKDARFAIRQAILDVKLEIGKKFLKIYRNRYQAYPKSQRKMELPVLELVLLGL